MPAVGRSAGGVRVDRFVSQNEIGLIVRQLSRRDALVAKPFLDAAVLVLAGNGTFPCVLEA